MDSLGKTGEEIKIRGSGHSQRGNEKSGETENNQAKYNCIVSKCWQQLLVYDFTDFNKNCGFFYYGPIAKM